MAILSHAGTLNYLAVPPTDEETLTMYTPESPDAQEKEKDINALPLVKALRENRNFVESRPHLKQPPLFREQSLTAGTLMGPGRVIVPPIGFSEKGGKSYVQIQHVGTDLCGHPGVVHGGFLATLLDEGLWRSPIGALEASVHMTAKLEINYKAPAMADQYLVLRATTVKVEGRKAWVEGQVETLPEPGQEPIVLATASALYICPKNASTVSRFRQSWPAISCLPEPVLTYPSRTLSRRSKQSRGCPNTIPLKDRACVFHSTISSWS
jgi:3'-phosphoadenosine 5'-phosphosulfate synthase